LPDLSYSFITVVFMFSGLMLRYKDSSHIKYSELPLTKWIVGILVIYILMSFIALSPIDHRKSLIEFTKLFIIIGIAYKLINTRIKLEWTLWAYVLGATYIGYVATSMGRNRGDRLEGIGTIDAGDSNGTAAIMVPALIFLLYYVWRGKNIYVKAFAVVCGALITNGLVLINSRGSFVAAVAGAAVFISYMLFSKFQQAGQRATAIFLVVAGLGGAVYVTDELFWERMGTLKEVSEEEGDRGGAHRMEFWFASFDVLNDYPLGVGSRGFNMVSSRYIDPSLTKGGTARKSVHSTWFQALTETGWQGFILFIGLLYSCYRLSKQTKQYLAKAGKIDEYFKMVAIETSLFSFLVAATFLNQFRSELLYWLILFVACGANIFYFQEKGQVENLIKEGNEKVIQ